MFLNCFIVCILVSAFGHAEASQLLDTTEPATVASRELAKFKIHGAHRVQTIGSRKEQGLDAEETLSPERDVFTEDLPETRTHDVYQKRDEKPNKSIKLRNGVRTRRPGHGRNAMTPKRKAMQCFRNRSLREKTIFVLVIGFIICYYTGSAGAAAIVHNYLAPAGKNLILFSNEFVDAYSIALSGGEFQISAENWTYFVKFIWGFSAVLALSFVGLIN